MAFSFTGFYSTNFTEQSGRFVKITKINILSTHFFKLLEKKFWTYIQFDVGHIKNDDFIQCINVVW